MLYLHAAFRALLLGFFRGIDLCLGRIGRAEYMLWSGFKAGYCEPAELAVSHGLKIGFPDDIVLYLCFRRFWHNK